MRSRSGRFEVPDFTSLALIPLSFTSDTPSPICRFKKLDNPKKNYNACTTNSIKSYPNLSTRRQTAQTPHHLPYQTPQPHLQRHLLTS